MDMDSQNLSPLSTPNQQQKQTTSPSSLTKPPSITRRVPPPCWTHEETSALIESYHEKWYLLRRGNLRASHWEEVADAVTRRCNLVVPSKTSVQCRHKVEKLRKRYRTEVQKSLMTPPHHRFSSSWVFFKRMDFMEKGPSSVTTATAVDEDEQGGGDEEEEEEGDDDDEQGGPGEEEDDFRERYNYDQKNHHNTAYNMSIPNPRNLPNLHNFDCSIMPNGTVGNSCSGGFGFRIPSAEQQPQLRTVPNFMFAKPKNYGAKFDENAVPNFMPNPNFTSPSSSSRFTNGVGSSSRLKSGSGKSSGGGGSKGKRKMDPVEEMVSAVRLFGEGFMRMEQMKLEMAREVEKMRMDMELKRTEMILDSQQRIVDAFAKGFSAKKKTKKMSSPPDS
ncbi:hypothetical protein MKX01_041926 [Papaver californicum]|nr:hypothetical protein MKX01_041926 [Papaver californicum]